jgi:hypothetical protein
VQVATTERSLLFAALTYAQRGKPVFPCKPDKTPHTSHGFHDAAVNEDTIRGWWSRWPDAIIGMPTGRPSGCIVADLDIDLTRGIDGRDAWQTLSAPHAEIDTREVITPRGGAHLYFQIPEGVEIRNSASKIGPGIDIRGEGGYVILPPSVTPAGEYMLEASSTREVAEMPPWLVKLLISKDSAPKPISSTNIAEYVGDVVIEGGRNHALASHAGLLRKAGLEPNEILAALLVRNNERCKPPLPRDEVELIAWSSGRWEKGDPDVFTGAVPAPVPVPTVDDAQPKFVASPVSEILARPRPIWLVRNVLPATGVGVMYGASGSGKTFAMLDLSFAIVRGERWFDARTRAGAVVYIATEGALRMRVEAYMAAKGVAAEALDGFAAIESSINLLDATGQEVAELIHAINAYAEHIKRPVVAVNIDTLNRAMPGGNENASEDMGRAVSAASAIGNAVGCLVNFVHHSGKDGSKGSRGHSSLKAAADAELSITRDGDVRLITAEKVRDGLDGAKIGAFKLRTMDLGFVSDDDPEAGPEEVYSSCVIEPCDVDEYDENVVLSPSQNLMLGFVNATFKRHAAVAPGLMQAFDHPPRSGQTVIYKVDLYDAIDEGGGISGSDNKSTEKTAKVRALRGLEDAQIVRVEGDVIWLRTKTPTSVETS